MDALALEPSERAFLEALERRGVRYLIIGMSAALLQGARGVTEDVGLWFERLDEPAIGEAARAALIARRIERKSQLSKPPLRSSATASAETSSSEAAATLRLETIYLLERA